jgi:hypothetical protein
MALVKDESATLRVWGVRGGRQLREVLVKTEPYCFEANTAYGVLYVCKGGARAILYLWVGKECGTTSQAGQTQINNRSFTLTVKHVNSTSDAGKGHSEGRRRGG